MACKQGKGYKIAPERNKDGTFKSWPGGRSEKGAWPAFLASLDGRFKKRTGRKAKAFSTFTTETGTIYMKQPFGEWKRIK